MSNSESKENLLRVISELATPLVIPSSTVVSSEQVVSLIKKVGEVEDQIRQLQSMLAKIRQQVDSEVEAELRRLQVEQDQLILQLNELLDKSFDPRIVLTEFNKIFRYNWTDEQSLEFTKKLRGPAFKIIRKYSGYESVENLEVTTTAGAVYSNLGETEKSFYILTERSLPLIKALEQRGQINELQAAQAYYRVYDYVCGSDTKFLDLLQSWAENYPLQNERTYWITTAHTCAACRYLRINMPEMAYPHLGVASEGLQKLKAEIENSTQPLNISGMNLRLKLRLRIAYLVLMQGIYHYQKGEYDQAKLHLQDFIQYAHNTPLSSYAGCYASYLLWKIYKAGGNSLEALIHYSKAKIALKNSNRRNFCMFDYKEVMDDLDRSDT